MPRPIRCFLTVAFVTVFAGAMLAADQTPVQKAWDVLEAGMKDKSIPERHDAMQSLGLLVADSKAIAIAEKGLEDHAPEVREVAATTLGQLHSTSSIPKLELALKDKDVSVVLAAAHSLWALGDKGAYEVYYEILLGERKGGPGLIAGQEGMLHDRKKLAKFGFEQGIEFSPFAGLGWGIIKAIHKEEDLAPVRAAAATILIDDPDPRSGNALAKSCTDKSWIVRVAALDALARRGDPAFVKDIESHMADKEDLVRYTAAAAIIRLSNAPPHVKSIGEKSSD